MKRIHIHVHVTVYDVEPNVRFYTSLFGAPPAVLVPGYAEWDLVDPSVKFAISSRGAAPRIDHLGIEVSTDAELEALRRQLVEVDPSVIEEPLTSGGAAGSECHWAIDPQSIAWKVFRGRVRAPVAGPAARQSGFCGKR